MYFAVTNDLINLHNHFSHIFKVNIPPRAIGGNLELGPRDTHKKINRSRDLLPRVSKARFSMVALF